MLIAYRTVKGYGESSFEINRSVFISYTEQVESALAANDFINKIKKQNRDATHNCSAYITGKYREAQKADDDGEPSGTAGQPILESIKKQGLTETVIVVSRYFGGIKLGAGGLIRAYGKAASDALHAAGIVNRVPYMKFAVSCEYSLLGILENNLRTKGYVITGKQFADTVCLYVLGKPQDEELAKYIAEWSAGTAMITEAGEEYRDSDMQST